MPSIRKETRQKQSGEMKRGTPRKRLSPLSCDVTLEPRMNRQAPGLIGAERRPEAKLNIELVVLLSVRGDALTHLRRHKQDDGASVVEQNKKRCPSSVS